MEKKSYEKKPIKKFSIILRLIFIIIYIIILYFLYLFLINLGIQHLIIILILIFLILVVIGPLITGISKAMFNRLFSQKKEKKKEKSDYQIYKDELKGSHQTIQTPPVDTKDISLDFKYRKPVIRKCNYCKIIVPNFVKKCPNCGKPILD